MHINPSLHRWLLGALGGHRHNCFGPSGSYSCSWFYHARGDNHTVRYLVILHIYNKWVSLFSTLGSYCREMTAWMTVVLSFYRLIAAWTPFEAKIIITLRRTYTIIEWFLYSHLYPLCHVSLSQEHTTMCYSFYLLFTDPPAGWHPASWQDVLCFLTSWVCPSWELSSWYVILLFSPQPAGSIPAGKSHPIGKMFQLEDFCMMI